jgi:Uma2 family endonuclease
MSRKAKTVPLLDPPPAALPKMTYEEFLAWADEDCHAEWVDGEVIFMSPASKRHQMIATFLASIFQHFVEAYGVGFVFTGPYQMNLASRPSGREPDVMFVTNKNSGRIKETFLDGPADLVVEVISPESRARDRGDKFYEYEQGGVREYWLIDPVRKQVEFYQLGKDKLFHAIAVGDDGIYHSRVMKGLTLQVSWLWQEPLPSLMSVLKTWGLV